MVSVTIGLEIHQQIEGHKLFCSCPTVLRDDAADYSVSRHLHASAGESGLVDVAAMHESKKQRYFTYQGYHSTTCLVESDEEPPHDLNPTVLEVGIQVAKLLHMQIVDALQIMRKTVIDGSNTSGFQRTGLLATHGYVETSQGRVRIDSLCVEEEAAKIVTRKRDEVVYRLDRLGIPLIEIATGPDIHSSQQAKEVAEYLGMVLRSTGHAKRGIGTIRQDVNISIDGGNRVEVKGFQDLRLLPTLIETEVHRQELLTSIAKKFDSVQTGDVVDVSEVFLTTTSAVVLAAIQKKGKVFGMRLEGFQSLLGRELQPGKRLGTELSERAKIAAGVGGLFHSDELPNYGITQKEVDSVRAKLLCTQKDGFVLIADATLRALHGLECVRERVCMIPDGVVTEVRAANPDGTTSFQRPMPGSARMYPETDVGWILPPVDIQVPALLSEVTEHLEKKYALSQDLVNALVRSGRHTLFEALAKLDVKKAFIAETLLSAEKFIKKEHGLDVDLTDSEFIVVFEALHAGTISKDAIIPILAKGVETISDYELLSEKQMRKILTKIVAENVGAPYGALMGKAMEQCKGKADGKLIAQLLKELLS